jgi:hypothetical protein
MTLRESPAALCASGQRADLRARHAAGLARFGDVIVDPVDVVTRRTILMMGSLCPRVQG